MWYKIKVVIESIEVETTSDNMKFDYSIKTCIDRSGHHVMLPRAVHWTPHAVYTIKSIKPYKITTPDATYGCHSPVNPFTGGHLFQSFIEAHHTTLRQS
jgi:hypothetical protein